MKKTILIALMVVLVATPCLAQEVEPDGLFSIENTKWWQVGIGGGNLINLGFSGGDLYILESGRGFEECLLVEGSTYLNLLAISFFYALGDEYTFFGIMQPTGIGMMFSIFNTETAPPRFIFNMLIKVQNNWTPSPECGEVL